MYKTISLLFLNPLENRADCKAIIYLKHVHLQQDCFLKSQYTGFKGNKPETQ